MNQDNEQAINEWLKNNELKQFKMGYAEGTHGYKKKATFKPKTKKKYTVLKPDPKKCILHWSMRSRLQRMGIAYLETTTLQEALAMIRSHRKKTRLEKRENKKINYKVAKMHEQLDEEMKAAIVRDK
jgi:hypothetical protein